MSITLITPTGGRKEAFDLCIRFIRAQKVAIPIEWIVVKDDPTFSFPKKNYFPNTEVTVKEVNGSLAWEPGINTQRSNLDSALPHITGDFIFVIEDDDYYAPNYLQVMCDLLKNAEIVGMSNTVYYNLRIPGYKYMANWSHASLSQTGFRKSVLPNFKKAIHSGRYYIDIELWSSMQSRPSILIGNLPLSVGMKGLPGRYGLGVGHARAEYCIDEDLSVLEELIGIDSKIYHPYIKHEGLETIASGKTPRERYFDKIRSSG